MSVPEALHWFLHEVLPLEAMLLQFLRHNWRDESDVEDLLHDIYVRVYDAAQKELPKNTKAYLFQAARNLIANRVRDRKVVPMDAVADLDALGIAIDTPGPDQVLVARDELRRLKEAIEALPPRYRDVVILRRIRNLSRKEIALRLNLSEASVSVYLTEGMYALADILYGAQANPRKRP
ncbi:MAG TPA: sigma-70 family RNA polymerase sigma factor [Rhizomicrobium sp.]|nr:sigma-70 family RNA polymerase sigma factor [Rhizomicrobium sp.]